MKTHITLPMEDWLSFLREDLAHILDLLNIAVEARQKRAMRKYEQQARSAVSNDMSQGNRLAVSDIFV